MGVYYVKLKLQFIHLPPTSSAYLIFKAPVFTDTLWLMHRKAVIRRCHGAGQIQPPESLVCAPDKKERGVTLSLWVRGHNSVTVFVYVHVWVCVDTERRRWVKLEVGQGGAFRASHGEP